MSRKNKASRRNVLRDSNNMDRKRKLRAARKNKQKQRQPGYDSSRYDGHKGEGDD